MPTIYDYLYNIINVYPGLSRRMRFQQFIFSPVGNAGDIILIVIISKAQNKLFSCAFISLIIRIRRGS